MPHHHEISDSGQTQAREWRKMSTKDLDIAKALDIPTASLETGRKWNNALKILIKKIIYNLEFYTQLNYWSSVIVR